MSFASPLFLYGLIAAAGPLIIHLLNRQRYKIVDWAPMEFLLRAVRRRRRNVQLRDLLVLLLRTLAIIFFVLAMARPFWSVTGPNAYQGEPLHAVLVIDNSLSMGYSPLEESRLKILTAKANEFIRDLPAGSDVTVIPMCEQGDSLFAEVYDSKEDASDAVERLEVIDRTSQLDASVTKVERALKLPGTEPIKRIVVFSDMQLNTWENEAAAKELETLGDLQYVAIPLDAETVDTNTAVMSLTLRDGYAEAGKPVLFDAVIRHEGTDERKQVRAVLTVGKDVAEEKFIDLQPGQKKQVSFNYTFEAIEGTPNPMFVPVHLELEKDRLPLDDTRYYVAPVFTRQPVLFVDQYGHFEQPHRNRYGETYPLRMLFANRFVSRSETPTANKGLHSITIEELNVESLKDVRVVVLAGVTSPTPNAVEVLREFVEQGGQVLITAGGRFDPNDWTDIGWLDGKGILPAPLASEPLGAVPRQGEEPPAMFHLNVASLHRDLFNLQLNNQEWESLAGRPIFFKAIRLADDFKPKKAAKKEASPKDENAEGQTRIAGRFDNGEAFAVHKKIGKGNVVFLTTGCYPIWNNLAVAPDGGVLLYDQIMQWLVSQAVPQCNFVEQNQVIMPVSPRDQRMEFDLVAGSNPTAPTSLAVEAVGSEDFAVVARGLDQRDIYSIVPKKEDAHSSNLQPFIFAINGLSGESSLEKITPDKLGSGEKAWIGSNDPISLYGGDSVIHSLWIYLLALALLCLLLEMVLASQFLKTRRRKTEASR